MSQASKIIMVLSKKYLEAIDNSSGLDMKNDEQSSKAVMEYKFIENLLYESFHVCDKLIILWDCKEKGKLPNILKGRNSYELPHRKKDFNSNIPFFQLLGVQESIAHIV